MGCNFPAQARVSSQSSSSAPGIYSFLRFIDQSRGSHFKSRFIHQHFFWISLGYHSILCHLPGLSSGPISHLQLHFSKSRLWRMRPTIHLPFLHLPTLIFTIFSSLRIFAFCPKCSVALPTKTSLLGICIGWRCQIFICLGMDANNDIGGCSGRAGGCRWTVLSAPDVENVAAGAPRSRGRGNAEC